MTTTTTQDLTRAIRESVAQRSTVTVRIGSEEDPITVLAELYASPLCEDYDVTQVTGTLHDVWGTTPSGDAWRLALIQSERVGTARYTEEDR
jgi:hypothetical protein